MQFSLPAARYDFPAAVHFYQELLARVRQYPGVQAAGLVSTLPGDGYDGDTGFTVQGQPLLPQKKGQLALTRWVDPGYFAAIGIPFESGHTFDDDQVLATGSQVIISSAMQRQYFPGKDPVGATILTQGERQYRIAGVVGDTLFSLGEQVQPMIYFPIYTLDSKIRKISTHARRWSCVPGRMSLNSRSPCRGSFKVSTAIWRSRTFSPWIR